MKPGTLSISVLGTFAGDQTCDLLVSVNRDPTVPPSLSGFLIHASQVAFPTQKEPAHQESRPPEPPRVVTNGSVLPDNYLAWASLENSAPRRVTNLERMSVFAGISYDRFLALNLDKINSSFLRKEKKKNKPN